MPFLLPNYCQEGRLFLALGQIKQSALLLLLLNGHGEGPKMSVWHHVLSAADYTSKSDYGVVLYKKQFTPSSPKIICPDAQ